MAVETSMITGLSMISEIPSTSPNAARLSSAPCRRAMADWIVVDMFGQHASGQIFGFGESCLLQEFHGLGAASSGAAMHDHVFARIKLMHAPGQIVQRDKMAVEVADLIFVRLADIQNKHIFFGVEPPF